MNKSETRAALLKRRAQAHKEELSGDVHAMAHWLAAQVSDGQILGAYQPIKTERDPAPILDGLNLPLAFPRVMAPDTPLTFFQVTGPDDFEAGSFGVMEPIESLPIVIPDVILVPLVGFDAAGFRLGYGGGFYDRTLEKFRAEKDVRAFGFAYDGQLSAQGLDFETTDLALDMILTPTARLMFGPTGMERQPW